MVAARRSYEKGGAGRVLAAAHRVAEGSQARRAIARGVIAREAVGVEAIEVAAAQLAVRLAVAQDVVGDDEDAVGHGDDGLLVAAPLDEAPVLRREVAVACADGAAGALDERRAQRPVGEARAAVQALAGASLLPGQRPAHEAAWPAVGKRVMSQPSSAAITSAVRRATPGIVSSPASAAACGAVRRSTWRS